MRDNAQMIEVVVRMWIKEDADVEDIVTNMDYEFTHDDNILDTEIVDVLTEF